MRGRGALALLVLLLQAARGRAPGAAGSATPQGSGSCRLARLVGVRRAPNEASCGGLRLRLRGGAFDTVSPYSVAELRAIANAANEDADLINNPPVFGAPAADSDVDSDDMTRPRLAGGIGPADLAGPHAHAHDHAHGPASASRRYVSLADDCKWCDQQYQKDVKLLTAGREGNLEGVLRAIDEGASVEARDLMHMNWTVVHHAAFYGHAELVERLIDFGADVDARDLYAWTPLHHAALKGRSDVCQALLHCGADVMALTWKKKTPLQKAVYTYQTDCIKVLCEWMGIPPDDFLAEEPPDPALMRQALSIDTLEETRILRGKRHARAAAAADSDLDDELVLSGAEKVIDPDLQEDVGLEKDRTKQQEEEAAAFRAEYVRQFQKSRELGGRNPAIFE